MELRGPFEPPILLVHGGCGSGLPATMSPDNLAAYRAGLFRSMEAGFDMLSAGKSALDAVVAATIAMEDDPTFNAGPVGSTFNREAEVEMEASLMDGRARRAGAVASVQDVKNPISVARLVMERTDHVSIVGPAARAFSREFGLPVVGKELQGPQSTLSSNDDPTALGTVGAVALDVHGHLAAATSSGGLSNKAAGRVGDSGQIGAGTWADDRSIAVSATGRGEAFVRSAFCARLAAMHSPGSRSLHDNCVELLRDVLDVSGSGGCIVLDRTGLVAMPYSTRLMHRGLIWGPGRTCVASGEHPEI